MRSQPPSDALASSVTCLRLCFRMSAWRDCSVWCIKSGLWTHQHWQLLGGAGHPHISDYFLLLTLWYTWPCQESYAFLAFPLFYTHHLLFYEAHIHFLRTPPFLTIIKLQPSWVPFQVMLYVFCIRNLTDEFEGWTLKSWWIYSCDWIKA